MRPTLLLVLLLLLPTRALAGAMPMAPEPVPWPGLEVTGPVRVRAPVVAVACSGDGPGPIGCAVSARFELVTDVGGTATVRGEPELLRVDGAPALPSFEILPGVPTRVELRVSRELGVDERPIDPWFMSPLWMRHMVLGESETMSRSGQSVSGALVEGAEVLVEEAVSIDARDADEVRVTLDGRAVDGGATLAVRYLDVGLSREVPPNEPGPIRNGGPLLGLGVRGDLFREDDGRFLVRVGYSLALGEYFFGTLEVETNFESIMEAVVLEASTPSLLVIFPGLFGGAGAVFRQLGNRDADAALRLRLGVTFPVVSFVGDFDYWPAIGDWTGSMVVRLSI